ncbi:hypothetical protein TYRP_015335 [Tyrophagus putrescentiae]|nr:hypothetical protein TYRP_015335 [Tyrophagus putrescentiae]
MNPRQSIESGDSRPSSLSSQSPSINGDSEVEMGDNENQKVDAEVQTNGGEKVCSTFDLESGQPEKTTKTIQSTSDQMPRKPESRLIAYLKRASNVSPFFHKWFSAILYAVCSTLIMLINKIVLTSYGFPSFKILALGQMLATVVLLHLARATGIVTFPRFSFTVVRNIFPIPLLYAGNLLSGLGSTKRLNLPMYTVLRRVAILFTMIAEYYLLR